jgi:PAS domain S-box-containing protein
MSSNHQNGNVTDNATRKEQAKTRTEQAETRSDQDKTRTEQAEIRTQQAGTRSEQAGTKTDQAKTRTEQAETQTKQAGTQTEQDKTRTEQAGMQKEQAGTRSDQAKTHTEQAETRTKQAGTTTEQAETRTEQNKTRTEQAETHTEQARTRTEQAETRTEQARTWTMEQSLRASELSYRRLFEAARDGILLLDVDTGRITDVNPFLVELLGFSHDEIVGKTVGELSPFKDVVSNQAMLERLQKDGYVRYENLPLETRDGRKKAVEFVSNIYQAGDKKVIQCNVRDITERKQAELALIRLGAIVDSSDDAIIGKDLNSSITSWNKGAEKIFGYTAGEMVGTSIMRLIPADRKDEENHGLENIKRGKSVEHFETLRQTKDGRLINVAITISAIKDAAGEIIGVSKVAHDISDRKAAEKKIRQLNVELEQRVVERTAELEAANKELEAFSYSISHDLRAPLRAVNGFAGIVLEDFGPQLPEEGRGYLERIRAGALRMGELIDDLLAFSRLSRQAVNRQNVNTVELVQNALDELKPQRDGRQIEIQIGNLPVCHGDAALLKQIWVNLISNAIKYTRGREPAIVEIGSMEDDGGRASGVESQTAPPSTLDARPSTVFFVRDNGAGFDMQYANKLFGVFQRLHRADEFEGTGVGLAIVQRIVHRHGGRVWAKAEVNRGATFYFTIGEAKL